MDKAATDMQSSGSGMIGNTFMAAASGLLMLFLLPVYMFLFMYYRKLIRDFLTGVFKDAHRGQVEEVIDESKVIIQSYMVGLLIELAIVTVLNAVGFLVLGIQYAIFLALLAAVLNMIPYIGMLIASIICMGVTLTTSDNVSDIIWVGVMLTVVQFIDNNFIMPYVVGSKVRINALASIIGVLVGGALAGVGGMFLSIPGVAIMKSVFERVPELKPWGLLLGDDQGKKKTTRKRAGAKKTG
jgi:predicted PurR-regulated permease PerM